MLTLAIRPASLALKASGAFLFVPSLALVPMPVVPSLSIELEQRQGPCAKCTAHWCEHNWTAVAEWGSANGRTWEEAYTKLMKARPR